MLFGVDFRNMGLLYQWTFWSNLRLRKYECWHQETRKIATSFFLLLEPALLAYSQCWYLHSFQETLRFTILGKPSTTSHVMLRSSANFLFKTPNFCGKISNFVFLQNIQEVKISIQSRHIVFVPSFVLSSSPPFGTHWPAFCTRSTLVPMSGSSDRTVRGRWLKS